MQPNRFIVKGSLAASCALLCSMAAFAAGPVGELEVRGQARVLEASGSETLRINNTTYGWFSGDRIETGSSYAVLSLDNGASFGFGQDTAASVTVDGGLAVELDSGVVLYAIEEGSGAMTLVSGDYTFTTASDEPRVLQVSNDAPLSVGMVQVMEDGSVQVSVREGVLNASGYAGAEVYSVQAGNSVAFADGRARQVQVQVEAAGTEGEGVAAGLWQGMRDNPLLGGLLVAAGAVGTYQVFFRDDDDDPAPVSP